MDLTNRVLIISGALLWIFLMFLIVILAWGAPDESIERLADLAGYLDDHNTDPAKTIVTLGGLILALVALLVIIIEVAPPESGSLKVGKVGSGEARIGTDEIALRVEEELRQVPHLNQVQATVLARGQKAQVSLDLHVGADADLATTTEDACRRAARLIEEQMGVTLARPPQAQLHYRELRVARPQGEPSPAPAVESPAGAPPQWTRPATASGWERLPQQPGSSARESGPPVQETTHDAPPNAEEDRPAVS